MPEAAPDILENYRTAAASSPTSAEAQSNLGWGYYGARKYEDSIQVFRRALGLDANLTDAHYGLALAYKEAGSAPEAVAEFELVGKLAKQDTNAVRGRMLARLAHGHVNQIKSGDWSLDLDLNPKQAA